MKAIKFGDYWKCRKQEHVWVEQIDAEFCCDPEYYRVMIARGDIRQGERINKCPVDGFVFVWRKHVE